MTDNFDEKLAELQRLSAAQLRLRYAEIFGEPTRTGNKRWLIKRLAWRLQALAEGDLSDRARQHAAELANDADLRLLPPRTIPLGESSVSPSRQPTSTSVKEVTTPCHDERLPPPGSLLTRLYKSQTHEVKILQHGFEYQGQVFASLSALAKQITGTHCNGFWFFRLGRYSKGANS
jgi:hypothetical protein